MEDIRAGVVRNDILGYGMLRNKKRPSFSRATLNIFSFLNVISIASLIWCQNRSSHFNEVKLFRFDIKIDDFHLPIRMCNTHNLVR